MDWSSRTKYAAMTKDGVLKVVSAGLLMALIVMNTGLSLHPGRARAETAGPSGEPSFRFDGSPPTVRETTYAALCYELATLGRGHVDTDPLRSPRMNKIM